MRPIERIAVALVFGLAACTSSAPGAASGQATGQVVSQSPPAIPLSPAYGRGSTALAEQVAGLGNTMRVLLIAAHPDDEDTRLITWLARGRHVETAYLSLTRGDGGQNLIGNELGEALGVIRTEELLAARRIDGAHQYFSRAYDFGFSKSAEEAYTHWPHDSLLGDVVTVVRAFRPHVIIAVFSGTPRDGHGQHQVSGLLAREAYDVSGDVARFPVAKYGEPWTASKFYRDRSYFGGGDSSMAIAVGSYDRLLGVTYAEIAAVSRSQHKSQGFGNIGPLAPVTAYLYREATRVNGSVAAGRERSMFDGIDTTWKRFAAGAPDGFTRSAIDTIPLLLDRIATWQRTGATGEVFSTLAQLRTKELAVLFGAGVHTEPDLTMGWTGVARGMPAAPLRVRWTAGRDQALDAETSVWAAVGRVERAMDLAAGVEYHATAARDVAPIESPGVPVVVSLTNRGSEPLRSGAIEWVTATARGSAPASASGAVIGRDSTWRDTVTARSSAVTQPWWLVTPRQGDLFSQPVSRIAEDERLDGASVATEASYLRFLLPVVARIADPTRGEVDRPLAFVPAVSVTLESTVQYVPAGAPIDRPIRVSLRSGVDSAIDVAVSLELPRGLVADTVTRHVLLPALGTRRVDFRITGALPAGEAVLRASAKTSANSFTSGYIPIEYNHIRPQKMYRPAELRLSVADVRVPPGLTVGYIAGVGDNVEPALEQLGLSVTVLDPASLPTADLSRFTTIVVGPRAYEASAELRANNNRLLDFTRRGGTLVVQYGQYEMTESGMMPYPITLNRPHDRVTDENAPVRVLDPASPVLSVPNKINLSDFGGWVQERSLYMPHTFDPQYHPLLSMNDPGEPANDGAILVAQFGKGTYVYTSLAFFRQLPAGVPGAARLFVNLLVAGRRCCDAM